jgi:hypothetical protein
MSWLNLFSKKTTKPARKAGFKPALEALEDRQLLSVTATWTGYGNALRITSQGGHDNVMIVDRVPGLNGSYDTSPNALQVLDNGQAVPISGWYANNGLIPSFAWAGNYDIAVSLAGGNNTFSYRLADGQNAIARARHHINVNLAGGGANCAFFSWLNSDGSPKSFAPDLDINVVGGSGINTVATQMGNVEGGRLQVSADLRNGTDNYFYAYSLADHVRGGSLGFTVRGGAGRNSTGIALTNVESSQVNFTAALGRGRDNSFTGNLVGDHLANSSVYFAAIGGSGHNTLAVKTVSPDPNNPAPLKVDARSALHTYLDGHGGHDAVDVGLWLNLAGSVEVTTVTGDELSRPPLVPPRTGKGLPTRPAPDHARVTILTDPASTGTIHAKVNERKNSGASELGLDVILQGSRCRIDPTAGVYGNGTSTAVATTNVWVRNCASVIWE